MSELERQYRADLEMQAIRRELFEGLDRALASGRLGSGPEPVYTEPSRPVTPLPRKAHSAKARKARREYNKNRRRHFQKLGLCGCGRERVEGRKLCQRCVGNTTRANERRRVKADRLGLCPVCVKRKPRPGLVECGPCAKRNKRYHRKSNAKRSVNS